jgi:uncharacterized membrane protein
MTALILAAAIWIGIHLGPAGTSLRDAVVRRTGDGAFRAVFSLLSVAAIWFLVRCWGSAPAAILWVAPVWLRWLLAAAMLPAFVLFAGSVMVPNPTMVGVPASAPRGMIRVTRHPMLWSFSIWALVHMAGKGDTASLVFFGSFLVTALTGMPSIDIKLARRDPAAGAALAAATSILPFGAIAAGRNTFVWGEIGWKTVGVGALAWATVLWLHPVVFGVAPLGF